jgi:hypothetical protein
MPYKTGVRAHDDTVLAAEGVRQTAVQAAGSNQSAVRTAELAFYHTCYSSAVANGVSPSNFSMALFAFGVRS